MELRRRSATALIALLATCPIAGSLAAPRPPGRSWHDEKCRRYQNAWSTALAHQGPQGLGPDFLGHHAAFLASNCTRRADVCPRTPQEFALANTMVVLAMNFGTASTFPPFACPR